MWPMFTFFNFNENMSTKYLCMRNAIIKGSLCGGKGVEVGVAVLGSSYWGTGQNIYLVC